MSKQKLIKNVNSSPQNQSCQSEHSQPIVKSNQDSNSTAPAQTSGKYKYDSLTKTQFWAYGVGHFVNDVSSACWFNYLLYYLSEVVKVKFGPYSILSGQIADALATPFVGFLSDRTNTKIGKRIPWYIGGYFILLLTFVPMWSGCLLCQVLPDSEQVEIFYYIFFPAIFNFGWASLQISHMSLVPSLSCGRSRRDGLNSLRNTFSFLGTLFVYCTAVQNNFNYSFYYFRQLMIQKYNSNIYLIFQQRQDHQRLFFSQHRLMSLI